MENRSRTVALDGGTTNTRARLIEQGRLIATAQRPVGVRDTALSGRSNALALAILDCLDELETKVGEPLSRIAASGMLTSEVGLHALPHVEAPAGLDELAASVAVRALPELKGRTLPSSPESGPLRGQGPMAGPKPT